MSAAAELPRPPQEQPRAIERDSGQTSPPDAKDCCALAEELRRTKAALRRCEARLTQFKLSVRGSSDGLWGWNVATDDVWYSRTFKALLGYRGQEFPNRLDTWKAHLHPDDCEPTYAALRTHLEHNHPYDVVYRLRTKEGKYRWFRARGKSVRDEHGRPVHMAGSIQDVSDLKAAELKVEQTAAELARSNQDLEEFAYVASHDLRAPLRAIKNLVEWMEEDLADRLDDENRGRLDLLRSRVERLDRLIEDLLRYSRAGRVFDNIQDVSTGPLVDEIAELLAPPPGIRIVRTPDFPVILAAAAPLRQVLHNLISNAVKHHDRPEGRIEVSARDAGDWIEFSVCDDGPGIPPEYHERVFRLFETLKPRDRVEGSGMGLAVAKRIVERLGGAITLSSGAGRGATFRFTWPRRFSETLLQAPARQNEPRSNPPGVGGSAPGTPSQTGEDQHDCAKNGESARGGR